MGEHQLNRPPQWTACLVEGQQCQSCKHWLKRDEKEHALMSDANGSQWVNIEEVRRAAAAQGQLMRTGQMITAIMAFCTFMPHWELKAREQWCGQWSPRLSS